MQCRVADRQGLLRGFGLSVVQGRATYLLELCESGDRAFELDQAARQRMFSSGQYSWKELFAPEEPQEALDVEEATTEEGDPLATRYVLQETAVEADDAEAMIAEMLAEMSSGSFSGGDAAMGDWQ